MTAILIYAGTFDRAGRSIDIPTTASLGRSKLHFDGATVLPKFGIVGYALFRIFPTHDSCSRVTIDSIVVSAAPIACATVTTDSLSAELCSGLGCGTAILSDRVRYGRMPNFTLQPNPASHDVLLEADANVGEGRVVIVDALGRVCSESEFTLFGHRPIKLSIESLGSGEYFVRVTTPSINTTLPLHIVK